MSTKEFQIMALEQKIRCNKNLTDELNSWRSSNRKLSSELEESFRILATELSSQILEFKLQIKEIVESTIRDKKEGE